VSSDAEALATVIEALVERIVERKMAARPAPAPAEIAYLSTREAGDLLGVSTDTVSSWCTTGKLRAVKLPGGRAWRIRRDDVQRMLGESTGGASVLSEPPAVDLAARRAARARELADSVKRGGKS
jgi:excisionase family DNA binding protein